MLVPPSLLTSLSPSKSLPRDLMRPCTSIRSSVSCTAQEGSLSRRTRCLALQQGSTLRGGGGGGRWGCTTEQAQALKRRSP